MAGRTARFAHALGAGAWFSASPRVQRLAAVQIAFLLGAALTIVAVHQGPERGSEPLALAAATGPASAPVVVDGHAPVRPAEATRVRSRPLSRPKGPTAAPHGWAYWSTRIRGCESRGRPDAPPDYQAQNPESTASGAYQILDSTWAGRYGLQHASDASPDQQDAAAADLYRRHGTRDWAASAPCWRTKP